MSVADGDETVTGSEASAPDLVKRDEAPQDAVPTPPEPPAPPLGAYPPVPPPPDGYRPVPPNGDAAPRGPRSRKAVYLSLAVAGWLVIAAGTATTVVAVGRDGDGTTAVAGAAPAASASASPTAAPTTAVPLPTVTAAPRPTSTVKGSVSGSTHKGDLRFFLLPVPTDAVAYGNQDGDKMTVAALAKELGNPSTSKGILDSYDCSGGATRTYRTNDGDYTVHTQLMHFGSSGYASDWVSGLSFSKATSFSVSGVSNAKGYAIDPVGDYDNGTLIGISHVGDVEYEITVTGTGKLAHALLTPLMKRQEQRLTSGR